MKKYFVAFTMAALEAVLLSLAITKPFAANLLVFWGLFRVLLHIAGCLLFVFCIVFFNEIVEKMPNLTKIEQTFTKKKITGAVFKLLLFFEFCYCGVLCGLGWWKTAFLYGTLLLFSLLNRLLINAIEDKIKCFISV